MECEEGALITKKYLKIKEEWFKNKEEFLSQWEIPFCPWVKFRLFQDGIGELRTISGGSLDFTGEPRNLQRLCGGWNS